MIPSKTDALEAVLLYYSVQPWGDEQKARWRALTHTQEATTVNLCDTCRLALGRLPASFGDFRGKLPKDLPPDLPLTKDQHSILAQLAASLAGNHPEPTTTPHDHQ